MSEQLPLLALEPKLTGRQRRVLDALLAAGQHGLHADEAGALAHEMKQGRWAHSSAERCVWCGGDGLAILRRLKDLGLARYRSRLKAWQAVTTTETVAVDERSEEEIYGF
jgi:hypothetical protein